MDNLLVVRNANIGTGSNALANTPSALMQQRRSNEKAMQSLLEDQMAVVTEREQTCSLLNKRIMVATKDIALGSNVQAEKKRVLEATIKAQEEELALLRERTAQLQRELTEVPLHYQTIVEGLKQILLYERSLGTR
jgi:hypothetical protein